MTETPQDSTSTKPASTHLMRTHLRKEVVRESTWSLSAAGVCVLVMIFAAYLLCSAAAGWRPISANSKYHVTLNGVAYAAICAIVILALAGAARLISDFVCRMIDYSHRRREIRCYEFDGMIEYSLSTQLAEANRLEQ